MSAMQENAPARLAPRGRQGSEDGRLSGQPKSAAFFKQRRADGDVGRNGAVIWPFAGANGPMGKEAVEIGAEESALVTLVAAHPTGARVCAGLDDGRVWTADLQGRGVPS